LEIDLGCRAAASGSEIQCGLVEARETETETEIVTGTVRETGTVVVRGIEIETEIREGIGTETRIGTETETETATETATGIETDCLAAVVVTWVEIDKKLFCI
jgi:hypothetical protein